MKASVAVFAIRALAATWSLLVVWCYLLYSFIDVLTHDTCCTQAHAIFGNDNLGHLIEAGWIRRWKQCALMAPYMLVCALFVVDIACTSKVQIGIFVLLLACTMGFVGHYLYILGIRVGLLACSVLAVALLAVVLHWHQQRQRLPRIRRISLLYTQYFGVNGSMFPLKIIVLQATTVILQTLGKLLLLGEVANMQLPSGVPVRFGHVVYWLFFALLGLNATIPALLLQAESVIWQRVAVCCLDIFFDLMYTLVVGVYLLLSLLWGAIAATDALSFGSSLLPLVHILAVARAIEMHAASANASAKKGDGPNEDCADKGGCLAKMNDGAKGGDTTNKTTHKQGSSTKPLSSKVAMGFLVVQVTTMASIITSHRSLYPFISDQCAPCTCQSGVLDCRGVQRVQWLRWLLLYNSTFTTVLEGAFEGLASLQRLDLDDNQLTALPEGALQGLASLQKLYLNNNQLATFTEGTFEGLALLQELYLFNNSLTALPEGNFKGLASLQKLHLDNNQFTTLPEGAFEGLASLQQVSLFNNQLTTLPEGIFDGLVSLQRIWLWNNTISCTDLGTLPGKAKCYDSCAGVKLDALDENLKWRLEFYGVGVCQL
jgi:hypothetical protein